MLSFTWSLINDQLWEWCWNAFSNCCERRIWIIEFFKSKDCKETKMTIEIKCNQTALYLSPNKKERQSLVYARCNFYEEDISFNMLEFDVGKVWSDLLWFCRCDSVYSENKMNEWRHEISQSWYQNH